MKKMIKQMQMIGLFFALILANAGCSKDDSSTSPTTNPTNPTNPNAALTDFVGTWSGTLRRNDGSLVVSYPAVVRITIVKDLEGNNTVRISDNTVGTDIVSSITFIDGKSMYVPILFGQVYTLTSQSSMKVTYPWTPEGYTFYNQYKDLTKQ